MLLEVVIYACLVVVYFYLVLLFLRGRLYHLYHDKRVTYAFVSIALMIGQGIVLEMVTTFIINAVKRNAR